MDDSNARRLGIKAKLFLAFCCLAGLTALASGVSWYVFADIGRSVTRVTAQSLPSMVSALSLAQKSSEIAVTAPALMASRDQEERVREQANLARRTEALAALIGDLGKERVPPEVTGRLTDLKGGLTAKLGELDAAIEQRLKLKASREARLRELGLVHAHFLDAIEPLVDDSVFDLVISGERVTDRSTTAITGLVQGGVYRIGLLLTLKAEVNLIAGLLAEVEHVTDPALIQVIRKRFNASSATVDRTLVLLPSELVPKALRGAIAAFMAAGRGKNDIFDRRIRELASAPGQASKSPHSGKAHERVLSLLTPVIEAESGRLVLDTKKVTEESRESITNLIGGGAQLLNELLTVQAEANLAAGLLNQAAGVTDAAHLQPLSERFDAAEGHIRRMLRQLPKTVKKGALEKEVTGLLAMGRPDDGLFALRRTELRQIARAQSALDEGRALTVRLGEEVARLVKTARDDSRATVSRSVEAISGGKVFMLILTACSVLAAVLVMFYYVGPRVIRPIENVTRAMTDLAAGDTSVDIPGRDRGDELGRMAEALGVFRDTAVEVQESNMREIQETRRRLSDAIESISEAFSLYDADDRLIICNTMYRTLLFPGISDEIVPGLTFESVVRKSIERSLVKDAEADPEAWLARRLARHREPEGPHTQQRGDGRWILVSERKTEDGGTVAVYSDITELKQREEELSAKTQQLEQLSNQLAKYLSPQVYESIFTGRQEVKVASQRKKLTVFFSDIAGFTETADRLESEELSQFLNHYLTEMSRIALDYGATIDKYVGDAIVIFFGDPESKGVKEDALACVRMAIAMRERLKELQVIWRDSGIEDPLTCRMGINTGYCTVGNFGSEDRMDYTIIGGGVNLAARLESAATPGEILIAYSTYALVKDEVECLERDRITVKGIAYPVSTYEVVDSRDKIARARRRIRADQANLKLNLDPEAMSEDERREAAEILRSALSEIATDKPR